MGHRTSEGKDIDLLRVTATQCFGTFLDCRPGSIDIVYQEHSFPFQAFWGYNRKCAAHIGPALGLVELGLGHGRPGAF